MTEVSKKTLQEEVIDTDVLVVGAGDGGLMAAITAADCGARVTLCEKGNARRSGGIIGGNDHFRCYIPEIHSPALKENFIRATLGMADEDLVRKSIELSYDVLKKWESWGINMKREGHYEFTGHSWPGSSGKMGEPGKTNRMHLHISDDKVCVKLEKQARDRGVNIINRIMVTELLKDANGRVVGAFGISTREPKLLIFQAKSIILNKGAMGVGGGRLYPPPHLRGYSMAGPGTGDGAIMSYRIGADVQNAEFSHRQVCSRFGPTSGKGTWIGVLRDMEGKPIAPPYLSKPDAELGDPAVENADAIDNVWAMGKGPVWMDPRGISEEDEQYMRWGFLSEDLHAFLNWVDEEKIDIKKTRFEFTVVQAGTGLQARVDANFKTSVDGLYSISTGGLSGSAVGGMVAAEAAAEYARRAESSDLKQHRDKILQAKQQYEEILNREGTQFANWREVQWAIWQIMHCYALPPRRTESTLMAGYNQLLRIRGKARQLLQASNQHDLYHCLEVLNLLDIAELVLLAVNERKESRGQAHRLDYPFENPMLSNNILVITQKDGKHTFRWEKPRRIPR